MVPDWIFGGMDYILYQILHHELALFVILEFNADFQLPGMAIIASRRQSYLEDFDGS